MKTKQLGKTNLWISRIGLGTVEIGMAYGLGSKKLLLSDQKADYLLKSAVEMGITYFDTATSYGLAEERIGKSGIARMKGVVIGTKCGQFLEKKEAVSEVEIKKRIRKEVETSLRKLKLDTLTLLQFHGGSKEQIENGLLPEIIQKLKNDGLVQYGGISIRDEKTALVAIKSGYFDTIQLAYSILDQRMSKSVLPESEKKGIGIINRSVFLKGVLTPAIKYLPDDLALLSKYVRQAEKIARQNGIDLPTLAIKFVLANDAMATSLVGTDSLGHLKNAENAMKIPLPEKVRQDLFKLAVNDPNQVDPSRWPLL